MVVQRVVLGVQQGGRTGQELTAAADGLELQDEEAQAEHGSHLLQLAGAKLETLPGRPSIGSDYAERGQGAEGRKVSRTRAHPRR